VRHLHLVTGGRFEATCGNCLRPSLRVAAVDAAHAWDELQRHTCRPLPKKKSAEKNAEALDQARKRVNDFIDDHVRPEVETPRKELEGSGHRIHVTDHPRDVSQSNHTERGFVVRSVPRPLVGLPNEQAGALDVMFGIDLTNGDLVVQSPIGTDHIRIERGKLGSENAKWEIWPLLLERVEKVLTL
jgi:hypothetical protein